MNSTEADNISHETNTNTSSGSDVIATEKPPYSQRVRFKSRLLEVTVRLQRIPDMYINLVPTDTEFYLDTLGYTKKYLLRFTYDQNVKVDTTSCQVKYEGDYLKATFPIVEVKDFETGKVIRKRSIDAPQEKVKVKVKTKKNSPQEKKKKKIMNQTVSAPPEQNLATLQLIEEINAKEDSKRNEKLQKQEARDNHFQERVNQKEQKKRKRKELREQSLADIKQQKQKSVNGSVKKKETAAKSGKRLSVSFNDTLQVKQITTQNKSLNVPKSNTKPINNKQKPPTPKQNSTKGKRPKKRQRKN